MPLPKRTPVNLSEQAEAGLLPGWAGKRYWPCTDGKWHLIMAVLKNGIVDTLCCSDVTLTDDTKGKELQPMCDECLTVHGLNKK
jgi:hypothetical protein